MLSIGLAQLHIAPANHAENSLDYFVQYAEPAHEAETSPRDTVYGPLRFFAF